MANKERTSVGLVSDTHGYVDPFLHEAFASCVAIVHAGDIGRQEVLDELETIAPVFAVKGNIDGGDLRFLPKTRVDEVQNILIAVMHIAGYDRRTKAVAR